MTASDRVERRGRRTVNVMPGAKWCPKCERRMSVLAFGVSRDRADGLNGWCRSCRAGAERERRARDPQTHAAASRARYTADPAKWLAKVAVARAIKRGELQKPKTCPACGERRPIEAHHTQGYERRHWLVVVWRCRACHKLAHTAGDHA